jgi:hypothetical protein
MPKKPPSPPAVFIASSGTKRGPARALEKALKKVARPEVWDRFFQRRPSKNFFDILLEAVRGHEFGVFLLIGEDPAKKKGRRVLLPRDNVIFELGLFASRLDLSRCFVVTDRETDRLTDIDGLNVITIEPASPASRQRGAGRRRGGGLDLRKAADVICDTIRERSSLKERLSPATRQAVRNTLLLLLEVFKRETLEAEAKGPHRGERGRRLERLEGGLRVSDSF